MQPRVSTMPCLQEDLSESQRHASVKLQDMHPIKSCLGSLQRIGGQNLYTNTARRGPQKHLEASLVYMYFPAFPLENKLYGIHQTSFLPVKELDFSELKTPLVYTLFLPKEGQTYRRTPTGLYSRKGVLLPSRCLLKSPFLEPLLRTLLRTLLSIKIHCKTPSKNPS